MLRSQEVVFLDLMELLMKFKLMFYDLLNSFY